MKRITCLLAIGLSIILTPSVLYAADPVIHLQWDGGGTPLADTDYIIDTTETGTPSFPDVKLQTGHSDWRVWSTDTDNTNGYGDIGVISCPASQNFGVKLVNQADGTGARYVKGISLVPTSANNYSNVIAGAFDGSLLDSLTVQANSAGTGGEVGSLIISAEVAGDVTIPKVLGLSMSGGLSGTMTIGEVTANGALLIGPVSGTVDVASCPGEIFCISVSGTVSIGALGSEGSFDLQGDLEATGVVQFDDLGAQALIHLVEGLSPEAEGSVQFLGQRGI